MHFTEIFTWINEYAKFTRSSSSIDSLWIHSGARVEFTFLDDFCAITGKNFVRLQGPRSPWDANPGGENWKTIWIIKIFPLRMRRILKLQSHCNGSRWWLFEIIRITELIWFHYRVFTWPHWFRSRVAPTAKEKQFSASRFFFYICLFNCNFASHQGRRGRVSRQEAISGPLRVL